MEKQNNSKYNGFLTEKGNYVWAGALTLAWKEIIQNLTHESLKINTTDFSVLKIAQNFNTSKFSIKDIDENSIYVKSGFGQETVDKINTDTKKKFPEKSFSDLNVKLGPNDLISYAYLFKNIQFKTPFKRSDEKIFQFEGQQVESFYAENMDQKEQILCAYYKNPDQFMICINGEKPNDLIYFIKNKEIHDCDQAIKAIEFYEDKPKFKLKEVDKFQMPIIDFDLRRQVKELIGKQVTNKNIHGYAFKYVFEALKLKIDQNGAKVQNQAVIGMLGAAFCKNQPVPKYFILDKEFWVVMKQFEKHPYLCIMVKDPVESL